MMIRCEGGACADAPIAMTNQIGVTIESRVIQDVGVVFLCRSEPEEEHDGCAHAAASEGRRLQPGAFDFKAVRSWSNS